MDSRDNTNEQQVIGLCNALVDQGDLELRAGNPDGAQRSYERAREMALRLNSDDNPLFAIACDKLGDLARAQREFARAREAYDQALPIFRRLAPVDPRLLRDLSLCLSKLGELGLAEGDLTAAAGALREHFDIASRLAHANPTNGELQRDLCGAYGRLMIMAMQTGNLHQAIEYGDTIHEMMEKVAARDPSNVAWIQDMAGSDCMFAGLLLRVGQKDRAFGMLKTSLCVLKDLESEDKLDVKGQRLLAQLRQQFGPFV